MWPRGRLLLLWLMGTACGSGARVGGENSLPQAGSGVPDVALVPPSEASATPSALVEGPISEPPLASGAASAAVGGAPSVSATASAPPAPVRTRATAAIDKIQAENGEVPDAEKKLGKRLSAVEKCVNDAGGIEGRSATLVFQFLVRAAGVIEGLDIQKSSGLSADAVKCVVSALKRKDVGAPSSDPVGVTVSITFVPKAGS